MALFGFGKTNAPAEMLTATAPEPARTVAAGPRGSFAPAEDLMRLVVEEEASDLHLSVDAPPCVRVNGRLVKLNTRALFPEDLEKLAAEVATLEQIRRAKEEGSVDFGMTFQERNRFRVSLYLQKGTLALAMRLIPRKMLSLPEIGLPPAVNDLLKLPRGLILITGDRKSVV